MLPTKHTNRWSSTYPTLNCIIIMYDRISPFSFPFRLILRDSRLMAEFGSTEGFSFLASQLKALTFEHFGGGDETAMFTTELLVEYGSIVKKLATDRRDSSAGVCR